MYLVRNNNANNKKVDGPILIYLLIMYLNLPQQSFPLFAPFFELHRPVLFGNISAKCLSVFRIRNKVIRGAKFPAPCELLHHVPSTQLLFFFPFDHSLTLLTRL